MARGSHTTWGRYDSRVCLICGRPIRITQDAAWMHTDDTTGEHRSAHTICGSPLNRRNTMTEPEPEPTTEPEPEPEDGGDDGDTEADGDTDAE